MMHKLQAPYSVLKVYNKHVSFWRSEAGFKLGMEAVFKKAPHSWIHGSFQRFCRTGLNCLDVGTALHWTRIEIRRSLDTRLFDPLWVDEASAVIDSVASAMRATELDKRRIFTQANDAFVAAEATGLFVGGDHNVEVTEDYLNSVVTATEHFDANRLAYRLGWVYTRTVSDIHDADVRDAPWGVVGPFGAGRLADPDFRFADTLRRTAAPALGAFGPAEFTVEAHRLATELDWVTVARGDLALAGEMRRVGRLIHWVRYARGPTTKFRFLFNTGRNGKVSEFLEDAVLEILLGYDPELLKHYQPAEALRREGVVVVA